MKIKSLIRRAGGSTVQMDQTVYRFTPENDHACEVDDEAHIERFLAVSTFKEADAAEAEPKAAKADGGQGDGEAKAEAKAKTRTPRQPKAAKAESKAAA